MSAFWKSDGAIGDRYIADDGEVLERIRHDTIRGEHVIVSTGKSYYSREHAMKAVERMHKSPDVEDVLRYMRGHP